MLFSQEVAKLLGVSQESVRQFVHQKKLTPHKKKFRGVWNQFSSAEVERFARVHGYPRKKLRAPLDSK